MQVTLIYNPHAGGLGDLSSEKLLAALRNAGYDAAHAETRSEHDLARALAGVSGLVVVAGGDGTLRGVATRLVGKPVALFPLPLGTANNVCKALGIRGEALQLIGGLAEPRTRPLDLGRVRGPWGESYFLEAFGFGLFADLLETYDPEAGKSVLRAVRTVAETLIDHRPRLWQFTLDGRDLSGEYLLVEVLNTRATGSRLKLAPNADPGDGLLDVVCVSEHDRDNLLSYAKGLLDETFAELSSVTTYRGKHLEITWDGFPVHLDATARARRGGTPSAGPGAHEGRRAREAKQGAILIDVVPKALEIWLPEGL